MIPSEPILKRGDERAAGLDAEKRARGKKRLILGAAIALLAFLFAAALYWPFWPVPVVRDPAASRIIGISLENGRELRSVDQNQYDEQSILAYLNTCFERRAPSRNLSYQIGNEVMVIHLWSGQRLKFVVLDEKGVFSFSYDANGGPRFNIEQGTEVFAAVKRMLNYD